MFTDVSLPEVPPEERAALYESTIMTLAQLHSYSYEKLGLGDFGRTEGYCQRQVLHCSLLNDGHDYIRTLDLRSIESQGFKKD